MQRLYNIPLIIKKQTFPCYSGRKESLFSKKAVETRRECRRDAPVCRRDNARMP